MTLMDHALEIIDMMDYFKRWFDERNIPYTAADLIEVTRYAIQLEEEKNG